MRRVWGLCLALALIASAASANDDVAAAMAKCNYKVAKGSMYSWCGYPGPCAVPTQAVVLLEKQGPSEVMIGDTFSYRIQISNRSNVDMIAVTIEDSLPEGMEIESIDPKPDSRDGLKAFWNLGTIPAKTAKIITVTGKACQFGCLISNANAKVCFEMPLPLVTRVVQCNVTIQKTLPAVASLCDVIPMTLTVCNAGSAPATNVCINDKLPEGLVTTDGKSEVSIAVGTLAVGASKTFTVNLKPTRVGDFCNTATVTADRNCYAQSSANVKVVAPVLCLSVSAPSMAYICTNVPYQITVQNTGDYPACNTILTQTIKGKLNIISVEGGKKVAGNKAAWALGTLQPGESRTVCLVGNPPEAGDVLSQFCVTADCAEPKSVNHCLNVQGVPGVLTSLKDNCDPVQLGGVVTYTVTATNTGSKLASNLVYTIDLDNGMEFVSGRGVTAVTASGNKVSFAPLASLNRGQTASWEVQVKATGTGDKRFTANLMTNELERPVSKSESTNFYSPEIVTTVSK